MSRQLSSTVPLLLCVLFVVWPCEGHSQTAGEIMLSDESLQLRYLVSGVAGGGEGELGFGIFLNENRDIIFSTHYFVNADRLRLGRLAISAGPIAYAALLNLENTDVFSVGLGAEARFELLRRQALYLIARGAYAPDILTFGSADNLVDVLVGAEFSLTNQIVGVAGYRLFEFDLLQNTLEVEESAFLGLRYRF